MFPDSGGSPFNHEPGETDADRAWRFAELIRGNQIHGRTQAESDANAGRKELEWLAQFSDRHAKELLALQAAEARVARPVDFWSWFADRAALDEAEDMSKHPRTGAPPNRGWFASTGGRKSAGSSPSFLDSVIKRNQTIADLTGNKSPDLARSSRIADELKAAARVVDAFDAGLRTGGKALVNGGATAIKNVATLGLDSSQLELIGVTKQDREAGYDHAVTIATASGEVLIAVVTGGASAALSKGGTIARAASGLLFAYDTAGNAMGVVRGVVDARQNGVTLQNGTQIAASALGLAANVRALRGPKPPTPDVEGFIQKCPRKTTPTKSAANQYEIKHTGPYNYTIEGGGATFDIDGYNGTTILEAKCVTKPSSSPFVSGSSIPPAIREKVLSDVRDEFKRLRTIIQSKSTPFHSVEVITNSPESKKTFEALLKEQHLPGTVRLAK